MRMTIILGVSFLLASLPLVVAAFFRIFTLPRKVQALTADVQKLQGTGDGNLPAGQSQTTGAKTYSAADIPGLAKKYFASSTLAIPSALLTALYFATFLLCDSYLRLRYVEKANAWLFPRNLSKPAFLCCTPSLACTYSI